MEQAPIIRVPLAGNPNSGKTSTFNALTRSHQHVANYPGITVEKRQGFYLQDGQRVEVLDLPGTYSLTSYSPEERVAQDELLEGQSDVVVAVVDSTSLDRSLVFVTQLMQFGLNMVLCLNMADEAEKAGQSLDLDLLQQLLGFPVVQTVGHRGIGIEALREAIGRAAAAPKTSSDRLVLGERLDRALAAVEQKLEAAGLSRRGLGWVAVKLLLEDPHFQRRVRAHGAAGEAAIEEADEQRRMIERQTGTDISLFVMQQYRGFVMGLLREVTLIPTHIDTRVVSDRIDSVLVHRVLGLPIFLAVMYGIFWLTFTLGALPMEWIESGFAVLGAWITGLWPTGSDSVLRSLLVDGIIGGVGGVIVFLPNIVLLFLGLALLEDTGYMARAAFLMDRLMHLFGLHGKSFVPLMTGFGCSVPGIMATRTLENEKDRLATMLVLPLMSCGARLPIWMLLIPAFFAPTWQAPMLWLIYMVGIILALVLALVLRKSILRGEDAPFVMELPPYRLPTVRSLISRMAERSWLYLRKAGTIILSISILMWLCTTYPKPDQYRIDAEIAAGRVVLAGSAAAARSGQTVITPVEAERRRLSEAMQHSVAGRVGRALEPVIRPLGFDWRIGTALLGAFAAKEVFVAQMGIVYALGAPDGEDTTGLRQALGQEYSPLVGLSLMLFLLIATPCMATLAVTRRESGSWRWALLQMGGLTGVAYLVALTVYQLGRLFG